MLQAVQVSDAAATAFVSVQPAGHVVDGVLASPGV
jgi:hypothetical protein